MSDINLKEGWMELDLFCDKYGERKNTIHKRVADGLWQRGVHYASPTGGVGFIHEKRATEWLIENGKLKI